MTQAVGVNTRMDREIEHFDRHYAAEAAQGIIPLNDYDRLRYSDPPADTIFPREYYYHLLSPLKGKAVLEIACGNGMDASIAAVNGAEVFAYDISEKSVELTRRRAMVNGVSNQVHAEVCGEFMEAFPGRQFDAVMGYAALHHLPLDHLADQVHKRLKPGGVAVFAEPVVNSKSLDFIRKRIPLALEEMTEDEQPLNDRMIREFARPFDRLVRREFQLVSRVWPLFPDNWMLCLGLHKLDSWLLKLPILRRFATVVVFALYRDKQEKK